LGAPGRDSNLRRRELRVTYPALSNSLMPCRAASRASPHRCPPCSRPAPQNNTASAIQERSSMLGKNPKKKRAASSSCPSELLQLLEKSIKRLKSTYFEAFSALGTRCLFLHPSAVSNAVLGTPRRRISLPGSYTEPPGPGRLTEVGESFCNASRKGLEGSAPGRRSNPGCISDAKYSHSPWAGEITPGTATGKASPKQEVGSCPRELLLAPRRVHVPSNHGKTWQRAAGTSQGWCWSYFVQDCVWVCTQKYLHITV